MIIVSGGSNAPGKSIFSYFSPFTKELRKKGYRKGVYVNYNRISDEEDFIKDLFEIQE